MCVLQQESGWLRPEKASWVAGRTIRALMHWRQSLMTTVQGRWSPMKKTPSSPVWREQVCAHMCLTNHLSVYQIICWQLFWKYKWIKNNMFFFKPNVLCSKIRNLPFPSSQILHSYIHIQGYYTAATSKINSKCYKKSWKKIRGSTCDTVFHNELWNPNTQSAVCSGLI